MTEANERHAVFYKGPCHFACLCGEEWTNWGVLQVPHGHVGGPIWHLAFADWPWDEDAPLDHRSTANTGGSGV